MNVASLHGLNALRQFSAADGVAAEKLTPKQKQQQDIEQAAAMLEGLFLKQLMKEMRATVPENELFGGGMAESVYTSMFDESISDEVISGKEGVGLREMLIEQLGGAVANPISPSRAARKFSQMSTVSGHDLSAAVRDKIALPADVNTTVNGKPLAGIAFEAPNRPEPVKLQDTDGKLIWPLASTSSIQQAPDLVAAPSGAEVLAAGSGRIVTADAHSLVIQHGHGLRTRYANLGKVQAQVGDLVLRGQSLGQVGQGGTLEFQVISGERKLQLHEMDNLFSAQQTPGI